MHEDPKVPNFVTFEQLRGDFELRAGMTLAVEPMVVAGRRDVKMLADQWTVITKDKKPAAHFEHTIAATSLRNRWSHRWKAGDAVRSIIQISAAQPHPLPISRFACGELVEPACNARYRLRAGRILAPK